MSAPLLVTRRTMLKAVGAAGVVFALPELWRQPAIAGAPPPEQVHLQFGNDPSTEIVPIGA